MRLVRWLVVVIATPLAVLIILGVIPKTRFLLLALARNESFLDQQPVSHWAQNLSDPDPEIRQRAAFNLGVLGEDAHSAIPDLAAALHDHSDRVRIQVSLALFKIGPEAAEAVDALAEALTDSHPQVRVNAALALIDAMTQVENSKKVRPINISVRCQAARALGKIGPEARDAVPVLADALLDQDPHVRQNAAFALGQIGHDARAAKTKLAVCLSDEDEAVRQEVVDSLALIDAAK